MQQVAATNSDKTSASPSEAALRKDFERIAQQMYTQNVALAQTNRTLSILRAIDLLILDSSRNLKDLSSDISKAILIESPYVFVGIMSLNHHRETHIAMQGFAVNNGGKFIAADVALNLPLLKINTASDWATSSHRNLIIDISAPEASQKLTVFENYSESLLNTLKDSLKVASLYLTRLESRGGLNGVMIVGLTEIIPKIDDIELIERLAEPTGIAIDNRLLYEENQEIVYELKQTNHRLKEIDATKDEFISMASHQLRTPLTSMKGYVSMVLDGEFGEVNPQQKAMLQQAFDSSQRMVYLISDLLNVSRLRTGKFNITRSETNLPDIIESELKQLMASAASRKVRFYYYKPKDFPVLWLDETKTRQVIMNFLDNSLYYTPAGGRVDVELNYNKNVVRFTVKDSGLGVSKKDQPYLFTKFYRAQNARKVRPDGTGLGLYMSKKIILAQNGTLIFDSQEGHGSTFGFEFPRNSLLEKPLDSQS
jgi:signal transduction histidine kinase